MYQLARLGRPLVPTLCLLLIAGCESPRPTENVPPKAALRPAQVDGPPLDRAIRSAGPIGQGGAGDRASGPPIDPKVRSNGPPRPLTSSTAGRNASLAFTSAVPGVLFENTITGERRVWLMNGSMIGGVYSLGTKSVDWRIVGAADITGDGQTDILFENTSTGERGIWAMNGTTVIDFISFGGVPREWHIVGVADFTGDGRPEVLWENTVTGVRGAWLLNGMDVLGFQVIEIVDPVWHIAGAVDLTGDRKPDVLFENTKTSERGFWPMDGLMRLGFASFGGVPLEWHIQGAANFGNGQNEILWHNVATGMVGAWRMSGTTVIGFQSFGAPPLEWQVRGVFPPPTPLAYQLYGVGFSPYKNGQDPNFGVAISEAQVRERLLFVAPFTRWVRSFGMTHGLEAIGRVAHQLGLKAACGAWLSTDMAANATEVANLVTAAKGGECDLAIVGSEVLLRGDLSEAQLIAYIQSVKSQAPAVQVATADVYGMFLNHPTLVAAIDAVMPNIYPYWEGVPLSLAARMVDDAYSRVKAVAGGKPVIVSEIGHPSCGNSVGGAVPSPANAAAFLINMVSWARAKSIPMFWFEGLDEAWKAAHEGPQGACWGLMNANGVLKPGMRAPFDGATVPDNWTGIGGPGTPAISFTAVPPLGSSSDLQGQVLHVTPSDYRVAVYIKVAGQWWTKPTEANPVTMIRFDGNWTTDITTGGNDAQATEIAAYLIPSSYTPPIVLGGASLPLALDQNSAAKIGVVR